MSGKFESKSGTVNMPIARKDNSIIERCVCSSGGQESITHYEFLQEFQHFTLVKCLLETGRTHQIRVHMSYIGHPLIGDTLYGTKSEFINRQALHCYRLEFVNPATNEKIELICDLPQDFKQCLKESK